MAAESAVKLNESRFDNAARLRATTIGGGRSGPKALLQKERHGLEVILITAPQWSFTHTRIMERTMDEAEYVLAILHRMRAEVCATPMLFDPDAQERIDEAIVCIQNVLRSTQSEGGVEQEIKAA
jgi:hypothetical protein